MAAILKIAPGKSTTWESYNEVEGKYLLMLRFYSDGQFFCGCILEAVTGSIPVGVV